MTLGTRIREECERQGIIGEAFSEFAEKCGWDAQDMGFLLNQAEQHGQLLVTDCVIIAEALGVTLDWLIAGCRGESPAEAELARVQALLRELFAGMGLRSTGDAYLLIRHEVPTQRLAAARAFDELQRIAEEVPDAAR